MTDTLTTQKVIKLLERAVAEKGTDYVYADTEKKACLYREPDGSPSCMLGYVFNYLGVLDKVSEKSTAGQEACAAGLTQSYLIRQLLDAAQQTQDNGGTWGEALDAAKDVLRATEGRHYRI